MALSVMLAWCGSLLGADFAIDLSARSGSIQQSARSGPSVSQPVLAVHAGEMLVAQWSAANPQSGTALRDITLHVFMDLESPTGVAKPTANAVYESAVILDFEPGAKGTGNFHMPAPGPGKYLLRVETIGASKKMGREYVAAIKVSVL